MEAVLVMQSSSFLVDRGYLLAVERGYPRLAIGDQSLNARFGGLINQYGLLTNLEHAIEFKRDCGMRVEGHAPFYVYSIFWRKPEYTLTAGEITEDEKQKILNHPGLLPHYSKSFWR